MTKSNFITSLAGFLLILGGVLLPGDSQPVEAAALPPRVVVVEGDFLGRDGEAMKGRSRAAFEAVVATLKAARIPHIVSRDAVVDREGLPPASVAVFPYNRAMTTREVRHVQAHLAAGGKVVVCFLGHPDLLADLGVRMEGIVTQKRNDQFASMAIRPVMTATPARALWPTTQVANIVPLPGTDIVANWEDKQGGNVGLPALLAGENGVFITAIPPAVNDAGHIALWRSVVGHLDRRIWQEIVPTDPRSLGAWGRFTDIAVLFAHVEQQSRVNPAYGPARDDAQGALQALEQAREALQHGDVERAMALCDAARKLAQTAFYRSYVPVEGEMRGVWAHYYAEPSWDEAMRILGQANINAVFPYMMSGGTAFYNSSVIPVHPRVRERGDYLAACVAAGRAHGVPVHARMLNMTTLFAPADVKAAMQRQGLTMKTTAGKDSDWLCPTHPVNRRNQVASALEMCAYGVDGIQFDYLRYPGANTCFCNRCRQAFEASVGVRMSRWPHDAAEGGYRGRFADWRREQLTSLVREITGAVRREYPNVLVSAAVFLNWEGHRQNFGQDWKIWVDEGIIDFVSPMSYTNKDDTFRMYTERQMGWVGNKVPLTAGIGVNADNCNFGGPEQLLEQIRIARELGARGFVVFNYCPRFVEKDLPVLSLGVTREPTRFDPRPFR